MPFVAMHELDFGEVRVQAGATLEGVERFSAFRSMFGSRSIVPDNDPGAPKRNGETIRFGELGEIVHDEEPEKVSKRKRG